MTTGRINQIAIVRLSWLKQQGRGKKKIKKKKTQNNRPNSHSSPEEQRAGHERYTSNAVIFFFFKILFPSEGREEVNASNKQILADQRIDRTRDKNQPKDFCFTQRTVLNDRTGFGRCNESRAESSEFAFGRAMGSVVVQCYPRLITQFTRFETGLRTKFATCGPTAHRESGDTTRQRVEPPYWEGCSPFEKLTTEAARFGHVPNCIRNRGWLLPGGSLQPTYTSHGQRNHRTPFAIEIRKQSRGKKKQTNSKYEPRKSTSDVRTTNCEPRKSTSGVRTWKNGRSVSRVEKSLIFVLSPSENRTVRQLRTNLGLSLNRSQWGGCSTDYDTQTENEIERVLRGRTGGTLGIPR